MNYFKFTAIKLLIESLAIEKDIFALDQILDALINYNMEILRKVQVKLLPPEPIEGEEQNEVRIEDLIVKSNIFNPQNLYKIRERYSDIDPSVKYQRLWTRLIDEEVEIIPRTKFIGSNEKVTTNKSTETKIKGIPNPSFCNSLIFESFDDVEFANSEEVIKCLRTRLIPIIPSTNTVLWYIRPHLAGWLLEATDKIFKSIDDQRIKKQLCDYEYLLKHLKTGTSPQALGSLLMITSAVMRAGFGNQIISENNLFTSWVNVLTKKIDEIADFKSVVGNEEFLTAYAISANVLAGCSGEIDLSLTGALENMILQNPKLKDGVAVFSAVETFAKLSSAKAMEMLEDRSVSSKRRLIVLLSLLRLGQHLSGVSIPDKPDEIELMIGIISKSKRVDKTNFIDPVEFKGLSIYVQSLISAEEVRIKSEARAFDCGSIPAALKYDAIFAYLLGSGFDLINLTVSAKDINFRGLEASTKDSKCLALLQLLKSYSADIKDSPQNLIEGFDRFDSLSWLKFIGSLPSNKFKFDVLTACKLLPRITWPSTVPFEFALNHVLSITPITNVPFINPSILPNFLKNVMKFIQLADKIDGNTIERIVEILYNNSDDQSTSILFELLNYSIDREACDELLEKVLRESLKYSQDLLKHFPFDKLNQMSPERLVLHSKLLKMVFDKLEIENQSLVIEIKNDASNVFTELKKVIEQDENELLLTVFGLKIRNLSGKARISASVSIIDLMFIYQQDEVKFELLSKLLHEVLIDIELIFLESKKCFSDQEVVDKFKSRFSIIPKDICDTFESAIYTAEFDKVSY